MVGKGSVLNAEVVLHAFANSLYAIPDAVLIFYECILLCDRTNPISAAAESQKYKTSIQNSIFINTFKN